MYVVGEDWTFTFGQPSFMATAFDWIGFSPFSEKLFFDYFSVYSVCSILLDKLWSVSLMLLAVLFPPLFFGLMFCCSGVTHASVTPAQLATATFIGFQYECGGTISPCSPIVSSVRLLIDEFYSPLSMFSEIYFDFFVFTIF